MKNKFYFLITILCFSCGNVLDSSLPKASMEKVMLVGDFLFIDSITGELDTSKINSKYYLSDKTGKAYKEFLKEESFLGEYESKFKWGIDSTGKLKIKADSTYSEEVTIQINDIVVFNKKDSSK